MKIPGLNPTGIPGLIGLILPGQYWNASGQACAENVACARMGVSRPAVQTTEANRPVAKIAPISGIVSPLFGSGKWMEIPGVAEMLASGQPFSIVALVEPVDDAGVSVVVSACSDQVNQYRECRADLQSGIRYITKGSLATSVISRTGMAPPAGGPYLVGYCDSGTKVVGYANAPVDPDAPIVGPAPEPVPIYGTLGHISRHGGRILPDRRTDLTGALTPIGSITPNRLIIGGSMQGNATLIGPMEGHLIALAIYARDLSEAEEWGIAQYLAIRTNELAGFEVVRLCEYRTRYVSTVSGSDTMGDGLFPDTAYFRPSVAQSYLGFSTSKATIRTEAPTWAQAFASSIRWSPACDQVEIRPYDGQRYSYWRPTANVVENTAGFGSWDSEGNGVWSIVVDRTKDPFGATDTNIPGTPFTVAFSKLKGPMGAPHRLLRKVAAVAYQGLVGTGATVSSVPLGAGAAAGGVTVGRFLKLQNEQRPIMAFDPVTNLAVVSPSFSLAPPELTPYSVSFNDAQKLPPADQYGWDTDPSNPAIANSQKLYVRLSSGQNPGLFGPYVDTRSYGICNFGAKLMVVRGQVVLGPGTAAFSAGDSVTSPNQLQGASMDLHDCHARLVGIGAGGFAVRGKGGRMRMWGCSALYGGNDGVNGHKDKLSPFLVLITADGCVFAFNQDEGWSMHDGCYGYASYCDFFSNGSGPTTSVYAPGSDIQRTRLYLKRCRWWGNSLLNGGQYPGGGFSDNAPGEISSLDCVGDAPLNVPAGATARIRGFRLVSADQMAATLPYIEPIPA